PDEPLIRKAFDFMANEKIEHVYSAGIVLLAIEARFNWEPPHADEGEEPPAEGTHEKKPSPKPVPKKAKPDGRDLDLAQKCVEFLVKTQGAAGWTYPPSINGWREDVSNTQYALLGLDAAERLGLAVPKDVYEKAQDLFVANQEKEGPDVAAFPVPGADLSYKELKAIEKETREKIKKIESSFKGKKPGELNADGHTQSDERGAAEEEAGLKIYKATAAKAKMRARGWGYAWIK